MISKLTLQIAERIFPNLKEYVNSFAKVNKKDIDMLDRVVEKLLEGKVKNVWFIGSIGTGKTTRAVYTALSFFDKYVRKNRVYAEKVEFIEKIEGDPNDSAVAAIELDHLIRELQYEMKNKFVGFFNIPKLFIEIEAHRFNPQFKVPFPEVAVLDDFGWEVATPYTAQFFGTWIEDRYGACKKQILTTNFPIHTISEKEGFAKTVDRLRQVNATVIIRMPDVNYRGIK